MKKQLDRREFLKLAGLAGLSYAAPEGLASLAGTLQTNREQPNILVVVFDAWSALNCSLYGYPRDTTPNINRLAERATVYHNHYAAGTWTATGTTGLLTGSLTWDHRLFGFEEFFVADEFRGKNIFKTLPGYHRFGYTHNPIADGVITRNFLPDFSEYIPRKNLLLSYDFFADTLFAQDNDTASVAMTRSIKETDDDFGFGYSLFASRLHDEFVGQLEFNEANEFPLGLPGEKLAAYLLEDGIDWLSSFSANLDGAFMGYCHFLPPHAPYNTRKDFFQVFKQDGYSPPTKPNHLFGSSISQSRLNNNRTAYDEYILYADAEFNRLFHLLEAAGVLENTWVILTSDHGELFERGERGHRTPLMFEAIARVPLLVFEPGQTSRRDIYDPTSATDLLPAIAHIANQPEPGWGTGQILPQFEAPAGERDIFVVESEHGQRKKPITEGSVLLRRGPYKLAYYFGFEILAGKELVELYNLDADPEELKDLSGAMPDLTKDMLQVIKKKIEEANGPYQ